jgi:hypothetical protein
VARREYLASPIVTTRTNSIAGGVPVTGTARQARPPTSAIRLPVRAERAAGWALTAVSTGPLRWAGHFPKAGRCDRPRAVAIPSWMTSMYVSFWAGTCWTLKRVAAAGRSRPKNQQPDDGSPSAMFLLSEVDSAQPLGPCALRARSIRAPGGYERERDRRPNTERCLPTCCRGTA